MGSNRPTDANTSSSTRRPTAIPTGIFSLSDSFTRNNCTITWQFEIHGLDSNGLEGLNCPSGHCLPGNAHQARNTNEIAGRFEGWIVSPDFNWMTFATNRKRSIVDHLNNWQISCNYPISFAREFPFHIVTEFWKFWKFDKFQKKLVTTCREDTCDSATSRWQVIAFIELWTIRMMIQLCDKC